MEKGFVENGFIRDRSSANNTTQLVFELSSIMEHPDVKGKRVCLKLGSIDLKQSQLLSIKALIESMEASIAFIDTLSEHTEASAVSLGIMVSQISNYELPIIVCDSADKEIKPEPVEVREEVQEEALCEIGKTVEVHADIPTPSSPIETIEGVEDVYEEETTRELAEIIPAEHFDSDFEKLATSEGLISEEARKS